MGCTVVSRGQIETILRINKYRLVKEGLISAGSYGKIWMCRDQDTGINYALKEMRLTTQQMIMMFEKEVSLLTKLKKHSAKGVVELKTSAISENRRKVKTGRMLFELGSTTLFDEINQKDFTYRQVLQIIRDLCESLHEIHSLGIYHFDIKPENIILVNGRYKLCDFGSVLTRQVCFSELNREEKENFKSYLKLNSTPSYRAPEMIEPRGKVLGPACDIWMIGLITYILVFSRHPFENKPSSEILQHNLEYESEGYLTELAKMMIVANPEARPSAKQLLTEIEERLSHHSL